MASMIMIMIVRTLLRQFRVKRYAISDAGETTANIL
jgi:hypothetical membrane protein